GGYSRINAQGIRDDRPVGPKTGGERRLLILGDSITFGAGVRTDQAFPSRMEQALKNTDRPWRVLNGGGTSYYPSQEADWLQLFGWRLEPDALAICFCRNDVCPSRRHEHLGRESLGEVNRWLIERSLVAFQIQRGLWYAQARMGLASATEPLSSAAD